MTQMIITALYKIYILGAFLWRTVLFCDFVQSLWKVGNHHINMMPYHHCIMLHQKKSAWERHNMNQMLKKEEKW